MRQTTARPPIEEHRTPPVPTKTAEEIQREQNRIQPVKDAETAQQKSMEAVAERIAANITEAQARDDRQAQERDAQQKLRELSGLPRGSNAAPQAIERLDKDLGRSQQKPAQEQKRQQEGAKQLQRENPRPRPKLNVRSLNRDRGYGE